MIKLNSKPLNLELRGYLKKNQRWLDLEWLLLLEATGAKATCSKRVMSNLNPSISKIMRLPLKLNPKAGKLYLLCLSKVWKLSEVKELG
jgi:hypothetical protein